MNSKAVVVLMFIFFFFPSLFFSQNAECLDCHSDEELTLERDGKVVPLFVDENDFSGSVHADLECADCHSDFDAEEIPHKEGANIYKVDCDECHDIEAKNEKHLMKVNCFDCHTKHSIKSAEELKKRKDFCSGCHVSKVISDYKKSVHAKTNKDEKPNAGCTDCHNVNAHIIAKEKIDLNGMCGDCHSSITKEFTKSAHVNGKGKKGRGAPLCVDCHGSHRILSKSNGNSPINKLNIPKLCGKCHKEDGSINKSAAMPEKKDQIHQSALYDRGIKVVPTCDDCHSSHNVLNYTNPESLINKGNLKKTCEKCHANLNTIHKNIIDAKLWNSMGNDLPACIDCHKPHKVRTVFYEKEFSDEYCMSCHSDKELKYEKNGSEISLYVNYREFKQSMHKGNSCVKCHTNINLKRKPVCSESGKVKCESCHSAVVDKYRKSIHGTLLAKGDTEAPNCNDCHSKHNIKSKRNLKSPTYRKNVPILCGKCHREGEKAAKRYNGNERNIIKNYNMSIHGKGLLESGLIVSATCIDCHTGHNELPASSEESSINPKNIPSTCGKCHTGIYEVFRQSIHSPDVSKREGLPTCYDCHQSHTIERVSRADFRQSIVEQCGKCHKEVTETYFETFHGKVTKLGNDVVAKCYDCHGSHNILPAEYTHSTVNRINIVNTCGKCHENSNRKFVEYLTHATHNDKENYPYLYYTYWFMTILLIGTITFFSLHTLLWLPRALKEKRKKKHSSTDSEI